jgi:predicted nucleic acid-binding protein
MTTTTLSILMKLDQQIENCEKAISKNVTNETKQIYKKLHQAKFWKNSLLTQICKKLKEGPSWNL